MARIHIVGRSSGSTMRTRVVQNPAPSIAAASRTSFSTASIAPRRISVENGSADHATTPATVHSAAAGELSHGTGPTPTTPSTELSAPESSSRNFQTLPLTSGGSAQMNTISPSTAPLPRPGSASTEAQMKPSTRLEVSSTAQTPSVRHSAYQVSGSPSAPAKLSRPTNDHPPTMLLGPTSLTDIWNSTTSG